MSTFFIADTHFNENEILRYENRPFRTTREMNQTIIKNWNMAVKPNDTVFHLGDVGTNIESIIPKLNGTKFLIKGNHDTEPNKFYRHVGFKEVYNNPTVLNKFFILSHEPLYVNDNMPYANIFGHIHGNPAYATSSPRTYCVCVERINYTPIKYEDILRKIKQNHTFLTDPDQFIQDQTEQGANETVIRFITDILLFNGAEGSESIRRFFRSGYCYYFAHMLKTAFNRGQVCWTAPYGHFVWIDTDNNPYDIEGLYFGEAAHFIPEEYMGRTIDDFKHVPGLSYNTSEKDINDIINRYKNETR